MKDVLIIACGHVVSRETRGLWSDDKEVLLCENCWNRIHRLEERYQDNIPIEKLNFMASYCRDCIKQIIGN